RRSFPVVWRYLLLVSEMDGTIVERKSGNRKFFAVVHRFQYGFLSDAYFGIERNAAACLYIYCGNGLGRSEYSGDGRRFCYGFGRSGFYRKRVLQPEKRFGGGR